MKKSLKKAVLFVGVAMSICSCGSNDTSSTNSITSDELQSSQSSSSSESSSSIEIIHVESVTITSEKSLSAGETFNLAVTVLPENATNKNVTFSSSNLSVALVNSVGKVTALKGGTSIITVTTEDGNCSATCTITVVQPVTSVSLNKSTLNLEVGGSETLVATVSPQNATNQNYTFASSKEDVATVDQNGLVSAVGKGSAVITVTTEDGGKTASCTVNVVQLVQSVSLDVTNATMLVGDSLKLTPTVLPEDADIKTVTYSSSDTTVASVDSEGNVTANSVGEATVKVVTDDGEKEATCSIEVIEDILPSYLAVGLSIDLDTDFDFEITEGDALEIANNKLVGVKAGIAKVKVTKGTLLKTYTMTCIDFGNTTGSTFDLATNPNLWSYANLRNDDASNISIEYVENVEDSRSTPLANNALKYTRTLNNGGYSDLTGNMIYLKPEIVALAKQIGYKTLSFSVMVPNEPNDAENSTYFNVYNCNNDGSLNWYKSKSNPIVKGTNSGNWRHYSFKLDDDTVTYPNSGIGFSANGKYLYLSHVSFAGADISGYASSYIEASATTGKSKDVICEGIMNKMFIPRSNKSTLSYVETGSGKETSNGGGDSIKLTKNGFLGENVSTGNALEISPDWIQAALKLGYNVMGIYMYKPSDISFTSGSFIKQGADGKYYKIGSSANTLFSCSTTGFVSIDIKDFVPGDSLIAATNGNGVSVTGLTFRNYDGVNGIAKPGLTFYTLDENII